RVGKEPARRPAVRFMDARDELFERAERQRAPLVRERARGVAELRRLRDRDAVVGPDHTAGTAVDALAVERRGEETQVVHVVARQRLPGVVGLDAERALIESDRVGE